MESFVGFVLRICSETHLELSRVTLVELRPTGDVMDVSFLMSGVDVYVINSNQWFTVCNYI